MDVTVIIDVEIDDEKLAIFNFFFYDQYNLTRFIIDKPDIPSLSDYDKLRLGQNISLNYGDSQIIQSNGIVTFIIPDKTSIKILSKYCLRAFEECYSWKKTFDE